MTEQQAKELIQLLRDTESLGLTFDIGNAYIKRSYIEHQTELKKRISSAIEILKSVK